MIAVAGNCRISTWGPLDSYFLTKTLQFLKDSQFNLEFLMIFIVLFPITSLHPANLEAAQLVCCQPLKMSICFK